jgi:sugar phosphate isomerase/epimerase
MIDSAVLQADRRLALSQSMLDNQSMAADLDMVCESGTHALGLYRPMVEAVGAVETVRLLNERGLGVSSIHLGLKVLETDDEQADRILRTALNLAAAVGAPIAPVSAGSCGTLSALEADEVYIRRLSRVAPLARELGVTMVIEPVHPFLHAVGYIHTIRHAARIIERVENTGICVDVAHIYWDGDLEEDIARHCDKVALVQVANLDPQALAERRWGRALLDRGVVPIAEIVRMLDAAGYRGPYESEILLDLPHDECIAAARESRLWFDQIWRAPPQP